MESPVTVRAPRLRALLAYILANWADVPIQRAEWTGPNPTGQAMGYQLGFLEDFIDGTPPLDSDIGGIVATAAEAKRLHSVDDRLEELLLQDGIDYNQPESFLDDPLWHDINGLALNAACLILLNGGCWDEDDEIVVDDHRLVPDYLARSLAAQCLASLADDRSDGLDACAPLRRTFDDAVGTLMDKCSLSDPRAAVGRIYRDSLEIPRLERLHEAVKNQASHDEIARLAGPALTAIIHRSSGWGFDRMPSARVHECE